MVPFSPEWWVALANSHYGAPAPPSPAVPHDPQPPGTPSNRVTTIAEVIDPCRRRARSFQQITTILNSLILNGYFYSTDQNTWVLAPGGMPGTPWPVSKGGTGRNDWPEGAVLIGNGQGALAPAEPGTSGGVLTSNGPGVDPTFQTPSSGASVSVGDVSDTSTAAYVTVINPATHGAGGPIGYIAIHNTGANDLGYSCTRIDKLGTNSGEGYSILGAGSPKVSIGINNAVAFSVAFYPPLESVQLRVKSDVAGSPTTYRVVWGFVKHG